MNNQLFKITWNRLADLQYETYIVALNEEEALNIFKNQVYKNENKEIVNIQIIEFNGMIVTKEIR